MDSTRWYSSKMDAWLGAILVFAPVFAAVVAVYATYRAGWAAVAVGLLSPVFMLLIYGGLVFPMRYGIGERELVVRFGLVRMRIPLVDIREVAPTRKPLSSPALSLDRLRIRYGDAALRAVMISPADRESFLGELAARAGLERDGDRLVRAGAR